jgi:hypothetical protein
MNPTKNPETSPELFLDSAAEFFVRYGITQFAYTDPETAVAFILNVDTLVDLFLGQLAEEQSSYSETLILELGSALGGACNMLFTGAWQYSVVQERWVVSFLLPNNDPVELNVFHKLEKRFENGDEDSITYLYNSLREVYLNEAEKLP